MRRRTDIDVERITKAYSDYISGLESLIDKKRIELKAIEKQEYSLNKLKINLSILNDKLKIEIQKRKQSVNINTDGGLSNFLDEKEPVKHGENQRLRIQ
jgi:hypothetical protein